MIHRGPWEECKKEAMGLLEREKNAWLSLKKADAGSDFELDYYPDDAGVWKTPRWLLETLSDDPEGALDIALDRWEWPFGPDGSEPELIRLRRSPTGSFFIAVVYTPA